MNPRNAPTHRWPTLVAAAVILTLIAFLSSPPTYGQANQFPPGKMTFQGFLTDASSPPVPLGNTTPENKSVIFKIYKSANGTASTDVAWAETQVVTVDKGHFSVLLGEGSAVSGFPHDTDLSGVFIGSDASDRWIGITVDSAEITPRIQFFAAPYAQLARTANTLASGAVLSGNVQIGTLSDPKVTLEFGAGKSGKDGAAGKIGYETFTAGALDIVGAGGNPRTIKLWDNVIIPGTATVGATTVNGGLTSSGSVAGLSFQNRDSSSVWQWYSIGGTARLWNGGDRITVSSAGVIGSAGLTVSGKNIIELGIGLAKNTYAGNIGYQVFSDALDIVGAGPSASGRKIKLWDNVTIGENATIGGNVGIGAPASALAALTFGTGLANTKIALWDNGSASYGLGIQLSQFRLHLNHVSDRFSFLNGAAGTELMTIQGGGNVGIGTSSPGSALEVKTSSSQYGLVHTDGSIQVGTYVGGSTGGGWLGTKSNHKLSFFVNNGSPSMTVDTTGRVGIGTTSPSAPLEVIGSTLINKNYRYFNHSQGGGVVVTANAHYSILASSFIGCAELNVFSDARVKRIIDRSDNRQDLETIQKLQVTDYRMVDTVTEGESLKKGFIAQEVEALIPEAVTATARIVPDIYSLPRSFRFEKQDQTLAVTLPKPHGLKAGDKVRIIADDSQLEVNVTEIPSATKFVVGKVEKAPTQIFVYGKEVPDFRALNYDRIFTTGIGAIQELARSVEALKKSETRIAELEQKTSRMAELEQKAARVDTLEREMAQLKKLVAGLAEAQAPKQVAGIQNISTVAGR